jgi:hypothetical protein
LAGTAALAVLLACTGLLATRPTPTHAQTTGGGVSSPIPCTIAGTPSTCTLTVTGFQVVNGVLTAAGTVTGGGVTIPFSGVPVQASGTCQILDLTLGPLHLDLLGLVVDLNQVHLTITAQSGSGQLLGNLLCAVSHLLDSSANPTALANLLNHILAAL